MHHRDPVRKREDLVEFGRDDDDRGTPVTLGDDPFVDELDRTDVDSRVGWEAISTFSGRENSRATTTFCWLPPDNEETGDSADSVRMSNSAIRC